MQQLSTTRQTRQNALSGHRVERLPSWLADERRRRAMRTRSEKTLNEAANVAGWVAQRCVQPYRGLDAGR
eukprot:4512112-Lingulodinium_polyedra.AAC.1